MNIKLKHNFVKLKHNLPIVPSIVLWIMSHNFTNTCTSNKIKGPNSIISCNIFMPYTEKYIPYCYRVSVNW